MSEPRRQHLLPQFYLRAFADSRAQINVVPRLGEPGPTTAHKTSIANVLVERNYYTITDETGSESFVVESALAELEAQASQSLRLLRDHGLVLSPQERWAWCEFMGMQVTRGRHFREIWETFTDSLFKGVLATAAAQAPDQYFERMSAEAVARGEEPLPEMTAERRRGLIEGTGFVVKPTKEDTIEMSMVALEEMASIFFQMSWKLVRFAEPCLFTSDHPVLYWSDPDHLNPMRGIGPLTAQEVRIPISPSLALILAHPLMIDDVKDAVHDCDVTVALCLNRDTLMWPATKQWLTSPEVARHPVPLTMSSWGADWARPWLRSGHYPVASAPHRTHSAIGRGTPPLSPP